MPFPFYKSIDGYITNELKARTSNNNIELSKLVPWIQATSNLGDRYTLGTGTYSSLFTGGASDAYGNIAGSSYKYRPNPIITDFSIDFASRGTLRRGTIKIKCFSPDQLTKVQTYFLEPGISVYIQWGWNYSVSGKKAIGPTSIDSGTVLKYYRNAEGLNQIRQSNNGCYDNMVGIITGGESTISGDEFDVIVKVVSIGETLMGLSRDPVQDDAKDDVEPTNYPVNKLNGYMSSGNVKANFGHFFDQLPDSLRTPTLLGLEDEFKSESDFINYIESLTEEAKSETTSGTFSGNLLIQASPALTIQALDAESPVNASKYVSFDAFVKLLNNTRITFSGDLKTQIDISDAYCGAFKGMFSTDESVFIPNAECRGFLNDIKLLKQSTVGSLLNFKIDNSVGGRSFVKTKPTSVKLDGESITLPAYTHGWLGDLYIENTIAMSALENQTASIKEILDSVLKTIEGAVEGLWGFQIVEADNGTKLRIADANIRNQRTATIVSFNMFGADSFFLDANFNLDIPKSMMGQIVMEKSTDVQSTDTLTKGLFSDKKDTVLGDTLKKDTKKTTTAPAQTEWEERLWTEFRRNIRIMVNPKFVKITDIGDGNLAEWCIYSHFLNKRIFNNQRKGDLYTGGEVYNGRPAPVGFDFTVLGMSGFQVGHLFTIVGLPPQYTNGKGAFQVEEITHKIDSKQWITEVKSHFRPFYK